MTTMGYAAVVCASAALLLATTTAGQTARSSENVLTIRGQKQELHHHPPTGAPLRRRLLFVPGIGGWRGWGITIVERMAAWGFDVQGLDTKVYLDGFTGQSTLTEGDIMSDFREMAEWMTNRSGERVTLVGWSEGAGLGVLAAATERNKALFDGFVAFGLGDENAIAWPRSTIFCRWSRSRTSRRSKRPTTWRRSRRFRSS